MALATNRTGASSSTRRISLFSPKLAPAFEASVAVQPIAIRYPAANGFTHPLVPYVGEQSLTSNLRGLLGENGLTAEIHFLPPIATEGLERKRVAAYCEQQIRAVIKPSDTA